ncbi:17697_t:CDS:2, partial [Racocetra fulgida]
MSSPTTDNMDNRNNDRLPPEILKQIFRNIYGFSGYYRDASSIGALYNCLLVEVISTYMLCLEDEDLREIERAGIRLDKAGIILDSDNNSIEWESSENLEMLRLEKEKLERHQKEELRLEKNSETQKRLESNVSSSTNSIASTSINPKNFTESISPTSNNKHELVLKSLLKLFADKRAQITYFSMNNVPTLLLNDNYFENLRTINFGTVLMDTGIRPLFEGIRYMNLEWDALSLDGFLYALGNVCKNLDSLSTNFAHDPVSSSLFLNKQQATDLAIFICSQTSLSSFILQNYQYFTNYFLESLNTQINSLKRLEFYAVDFEGCTFEVVASCKQLEYLIEVMDCSRFIEKQTIYDDDDFEIPESPK